MKLSILDHGFIEVIDKLGTDMTVINAARVSMGKRKDHRAPLDDDDKKLMKYLYKNKHFSPFRHIIVQLHIKAPEFVMRQWYKHVVGAETTSDYPTKDHAWNEISGRYTEVREFYTPDEWRKQSTNNKQGSDGLVQNQVNCRIAFSKIMRESVEAYEYLLSEGVAKEQARVLLPLNLYTEVYWTASFQAIANFLELRTDSHAQAEIREYADALLLMMRNLYPETMKVWFDRGGNDDSVL